MLVTRVIQCGVGNKVKVRQQEKEKEVKCFRYWGVGYHKWKCPNIEVERKRRRKEQAVHVVCPQKTQQERRLVHTIQKKIQEYCSKGSIPLEEVLLLERGWITEEIVATYVECGGCKSKGVQTYKNQEQGFLLERQVKNMWYDLCQEA